MIKPGSFPGTTWSHEHHKVQTGSSPAPHSLNIPSSGTGIKPYSQLVKSPQLNPHKHPNKNCPAQKELEEPHSSLPALPLSESPSSPQILSFVADSGAGTQAQLWSHGPLRKLQSDDSPPTHTHSKIGPRNKPSEKNIQTQLIPMQFTHYIENFRASQVLCVQALSVASSLLWEDLDHQEQLGEH